MQPDDARGTFKKAYEHAVHLLREGERPMAIQQFQEILNVFPEEPNSLRMLGVAYIESGLFDKAPGPLRAAIRIVPDYAHAHEDLGHALLKLGKFAKAEKSLHRAVTLKPDLKTAWRRLGDARAAQGKGREADQAYSRVIEGDPAIKELQQAGEHLNAGRLKKAEDIARDILKRNQDNVGALRILARVAQEGGVLADAEKLLKRSLQLAPDSFQTLTGLAEILRRQDKLEEAEAIIRRAMELKPDTTRCWNTLGAILSKAARHEEGMDAFRQSLKIDPGQPKLHLSMGHSLKTEGNYEEAVIEYRQCLEQDPTEGDAYWSLANLKIYRFDDRDLDRMQEALGGDTELSTDNTVLIQFALAKALEDRGDYDQSFHYYDVANATKRPTVKYDADRQDRSIDRIIDVMDEAMIKSLEGFGLEDAAPIFILGLPRAGSTLQEQILASHSLVDGTQELQVILNMVRRFQRQGEAEDAYPGNLATLNKDGFRNLGERFIDKTQTLRQGAPFFIDKMPNNFPHVGLIHLILPNAKIIDARRNPMDCCFSGFKQNFAHGQPFTYDLEDMARYYLGYMRVMDHWDKVLPGKVLRVIYEDVVADPETHVRRVLDHCGLEFEEQCLRFYETERAVRTASSEQVRQPIYTKGVEHWRHFETHLELLKAALGDAVETYRQ